MADITSLAQLKWLLGGTVACTVIGATAAALTVTVAPWAELLFYIFTSLGIFGSFCSGFYILFTHAATGHWPGEESKR